MSSFKQGNKCGCHLLPSAISGSSSPTFPDELNSSSTIWPPGICDCGAVREAIKIHQTESYAHKLEKQPHTCPHKPIFDSPRAKVEPCIILKKCLLKIIGTRGWSNSTAGYLGRVFASHTADLGSIPDCPEWSLRAELGVSPEYCQMWTPSQKITPLKLYVREARDILQRLRYLLTYIQPNLNPPIALRIPWVCPGVTTNHRSRNRPWAPCMVYVSKHIYSWTH